MVESREGEGSRQVKGDRRKEGKGKGWEKLWERSKSSEEGGEKEGGIHMLSAGTSCWKRWKFMSLLGGGRGCLGGADEKPGSDRGCC